MCQCVLCGDAMGRRGVAIEPQILTDTKRYHTPRHFTYWFQDECLFTNTPRHLHRDGWAFTSQGRNWSDPPEKGNSHCGLVCGIFLFCPIKRFRDQRSESWECKLHHFTAEGHTGFINFNHTLWHTTHRTTWHIAQQKHKHATFQTIPNQVSKHGSKFGNTCQCCCCGSNMLVRA